MYTLDSVGGFVAYYGNDFTMSKIKNVLNQYAVDASNNNDEDLFVVNSLDLLLTSKNIQAILCQINPMRYRDSIEKYPYPRYSSDARYFVASYDEEELEDFYEKYTDYFDFDDKLEVIPELLSLYDYSAYRLLDEQLTYCYYVGHDLAYNIMAAAMGAQELYYGFTEFDNGIMFSDIPEVIQELCGKVYEFPENSYYLNGNFYKYYDEDLEVTYANEKDDNKKDEQKINISDFQEIESAISNISDTLLAKKIRQSVYNYLENGQADSLIQNLFESKIVDKLDSKVLTIINDKIKEQNNVINKRIEEIVNHQLKIEPDIKISDHIVHKQYETALKYALLKEPLLFYGPIGCGKKTVAKQIAEDLNINFYPLALVDKEMIFGSDRYISPLLSAYKDGGVVYIEDVANLSPEIISVLNVILSNDSNMLLNDKYRKHDQFYFIGSSNTKHNIKYDNFFFIENPLNLTIIPFNYDRKLEKNIFKNTELLDFMWRIRSCNDYEYIASTEEIGKIYSEYINKIPLEAIFRSHLCNNVYLDEERFEEKMNGKEDNIFYKAYQKKLGKK